MVTLRPAPARKSIYYRRFLERNFFTPSKLATAAGVILAASWLPSAAFADPAAAVEDPQLRELLSPLLLSQVSSGAGGAGVAQAQDGSQANDASTTNGASSPSPSSSIPAPQSTQPSEPVSINRSSLTGFICDLSGQRRIDHAQLILSKVGAEHKIFHSESKDDGTFRFDNIEPGEWTLTVSAKEMLSHSTNVNLVAGETRDMKMALEDLEPVDVLRVTGKRTLIHPEKIGSETNVDHKMIYQYKSGNDLKQLIESTPGVMNDSYGNIITRGEHNAVNYVLDDVVLPEAAGVLQQSQVISPRSMQSMAVDIGGYEASDGGGPLGAVAHMKSLPMTSKPTFDVGMQGGGPLAGTIFYNMGTALSQNNDSILSKVKIQSSGSFAGTSYGIAPPVKDYVNNQRWDVNSLTKVEFRPTDKDTFRLTAALNQTTMQIPTSGFSANAGVKDRQKDGQNYVIASYIRKCDKWLDEANIHILNGIYFERFRSSGAFDPGVQFNNGQPEVSISANAKRFNYIFSAQGNLLKTYRKTHHMKAGFLTELRPSSTFYNGTYFNANYLGSIPSPSNPSPVPFGAVISPFTGMPGGPQFNGNIGKYSGFRYLQSAFIQDKYTPNNGYWKRLTLDAGVRFDMMHSVDGNAMTLAETIATVPGAAPFSLAPYQKQTITDAQCSGRFGAAYLVAKNTIVRTSFSNLFMPNPNDYFITPYLVGPAGQNTAGVYDGTPRPLHATRGYLTDTSIEKQIGPRFSTRTNIFYKYLTNFGDSGVVGNLPLYNRLTNSAQDARGVETRLDLKPDKDGYGFNGFVSNTVQVAYLRETKTPSGGFYETPVPPFMKFPDHDRRLSTVVGMGYKNRKNFWCLLTTQVLSGLQDERDPTVYGPHPARTPVFCDVALNGGYMTSKKVLAKYKWMPTSIDCRIDNLLNQRIPVNLGSPFQGTRYSLPLRVLVGCAWQIGPEPSKLASNPAKNSL